jgi:hypothetical protein
MATQLTVVNNILRRLREDEVTSIADNSYSKLIAQFVNDAKADMEDINHEWSVYVTEVDDTLPADGSTRSHDITETNDRSWLMRDFRDDRLPAAYDITSNEVSQMYDIPYKELNRLRNLTNDPSTQYDDSPRVFAVKSDADGRGWSLEFLWAVDPTASARSIRSYWYVPQDDLALDGTDDNTEILLPARPIELTAIYYAYNERGEEMGEPGGIAATRATNAVGAALETDMQVQKKSDEIDITRNETL